jgi:Eukaryotic membrane protein family
MLFFQVVTLNVAVNSYSNALVSLLMSNQLVEIKGTVFKKFEKENLFQMTCAGNAPHLILLMQISSNDSIYLFY